MARKGLTRRVLRRVTAEVAKGLRLRLDSNPSAQFSFCPFCSSPVSYSPYRLDHGEKFCCPWCLSAVEYFESRDLPREGLIVHELRDYVWIPSPAMWAVWREFGAARVFVNADVVEVGVVFDLDYVIDPLPGEHDPVRDATLIAEFHERFDLAKLRGAYLRAEAA